MFLVASPSRIWSSVTTRTQKNAQLGLRDAQECPQDQARPLIGERQFRAILVIKCLTLPKCTLIEEFILISGNLVTHSLKRLKDRRVSATAFLRRNSEMRSKIFTAKAANHSELLLRLPSNEWSCRQSLRCILNILRLRGFRFFSGTLKSGKWQHFFVSRCLCPLWKVGPLRQSCEMIS